jgi:MFS family permease
VTRADDAPTGLRRGLALLVAGAFFMEILDGTVIAPAAPLIAADLGIRAVDVNIAISGYLVTVAVLIPISGWAAERFGVRRVFVTAIAVFTLASAGCALAPNLAVLTGTRVLQGVGGALMVPVGRLAVLRATAKAELITAIAYLTWPALLAPVLAPAVGGVLAQYASWRWIFLVNVPLGLAGFVLALRLVPALREAAVPRLDRLGFALTALGVGALMVAVENVGAGAETCRWWSAARWWPRRCSSPRSCTCCVPRGRGRRRCSTCASSRSSATGSPPRAARSTAW